MCHHVFSITMGRPKPQEQINAIRNVFHVYKEKLRQQGHLPGKRDELWVEMSEAIGKAASPLALYTTAVKNYYQVKDIIDISEENATGSKGHPDTDSSTNFSSADTNR